MKHKEVLTMLIKDMGIERPSMLEIGTFVGDTCDHLLSEIPSLTVTTIDSRLNGGNRGLESESRKKFIEVDSAFARNCLKESFDIVWIDAGHNFINVVSDILNYYPFVKYKGIVGGHDYGSPFYTGVTRAVDLFFPEAEKGDDLTWWIKKEKGC